MAQIPFFWALQNNKLVHINDVERGLACNCICPKCESILIAHKGSRKENSGGRKRENWHFQHYNSENCVGGAETSIHLAAKDLVERKRYIRVPILFGKLNEGDFIKILDYKGFTAIAVFKEVYIDDIKPDILMEFEFNLNGVVYNRKLIVEIAVTHLVDDIKKEKIKRLGISTIEIQLSNIQNIKTDKELWKELLKRSNLEWIYNEREKQLINKALKYRELEFLEESRQRQTAKNNQLRRFEEMKSEGKSLIEIYGFRKNFEGLDGMNKVYSYDGFIYCKKTNTKGEKTAVSSCQKCGFHQQILFENVICTLTNN